jgi:glycosyltransferase involved in cell wall biosynthesis
MLARHFPPIGGAGVHRTVGSVRHLGGYGYEPVVVTSVAGHRDRWEPRDEELVARIPQTVPVHRVTGEEPRGYVSRVERVLGMPPQSVRWWVRESTRLACAVGADADLVYASCLPYETAFAGARVARALGRPWVADLEDPWALDEMRTALTGVHRRLDLRQMRRALATASAVVMCAPEAAERVRRAMPELARRIVVASVPIGYEPDDFRAPAAPRDDDGVLRIVHTGSMHMDFGERVRRTRLRRKLLGGTAAGLDILTRSHVFLVEGIERAIAQEPALAGRVELHLAGDLTPSERALADRHAFVKVAGLLPHSETVALMRSADLLFLPMHDLPVGNRAGLIPYKTYEYLGAGRPILAAVPDGDVRDMLGPLEHVTLVRPADVDAMAAAVRQRAAAGRAGEFPPPAELARRQSVAQIAAILDDVLGRAGRSPARPLAA